MTFKVGDIVLLNSGGEAMTVGEVRPDGSVGCLWFSGDAVLSTGLFPPECLSLAPTDQDIIDEVFGVDELEGLTKN
jgi:uncharacterized protein YodC (DUF2158 family)